jgi:polyferredoxin
MNTLQQKIMSLFRPRSVKNLRFLVQSSFAFFYLFAGYRFYLFYLWASGQSETYVPRPPSVEGFLPISALVGLKRFLFTGHYDMVHPAGLTIFMTAIMIAFLLRKGFCGWICPIGYASNQAAWVGRKLKIMYKPPWWIDLPLLSLKYLLLTFFVYLIFIKMPIRQIEAFQQTRYNIVADAKMLLFFIDPSLLAGSIMLFLVALSFVIKNFWCRYLCPYGALLGIFAMFSPLQVKRNTETCIDCKKCEKVCPGAIKITRKKTVRSAECIGCTECIAACPVEDCLGMTVPLRRKRLPIHLLPVLVLIVFFAAWLTALATGHWYTEISPALMKKFYVGLKDLAHP